MKKLFSSTLNIQPTNNLGMYLGFPLSTDKLNHKSYTFILDKLNKKLQSWLGEHISYFTLASKTILIDTL